MRHARSTAGINNDSSPRWDTETARAFRFPITTPHATLCVGLFDGDSLSQDDPIGRVELELGGLHGCTIYGAVRPPTRTPLSPPAQSRIPNLPPPCLYGSGDGAASWVQSFADAWYELQYYGSSYRSKRDRGLVRLRYSLTFLSDRARFLATVQRPSADFFVEFTSPEVADLCRFTAFGQRPARVFSPARLDLYLEEVPIWNPMEPNGTQWNPMEPNGTQ